MSLNEIWEAAAGSPFSPIVSKDLQFLVGFTLLFVGKSSPLTECLENGMLKKILSAFVLTGLFGLSENIF